MKSGKAFAAGVVGGLVMSLPRRGARHGHAGAPGDDAWHDAGGPPSPTKWVMGFILHLILSGLIALLYAADFEYLFHAAAKNIWQITARSPAPVDRT